MISFFKKPKLEEIGIRSLAFGLVIIYLCTQMTDNENVRSKQKVSNIVKFDTVIQNINIPQADFKKIKSINLIHEKNGSINIQIIKEK